VTNAKGLFSAVWKRREPVLWVLLVVFAVTMQWPVLKGWCCVSFVLIPAVHEVRGQFV
jgi:hypothetical protein